MAKESLTRGKRIKKFFTNMAIMSVTLLILLVIVEFLVRWIAPQELSGTWTTVSEKGYIINKYSWESQHERLGRKVSYRFNSHHLRGAEVDTSAYNILCLGDSFTFGWLLEEDKTYVELLNQFAKRDIRKPVQFLNGGTGGWGSADYRDFLRDYGDEIHPDMVLVFFNGGDLDRSMNRNQFELKDTFKGKLKARLDRSSFYQWLLEHSHLTQWIRTSLISTSMPAAGPVFSANDTLVADEILDKINPADLTYKAEQVILGEQIFTEMAAWCRERDIDFAVGSTGWFGYETNLKPRAQNMMLDHLDTLMAKVHGTNLNISDLTGDVLTREPEKYIIPIDQHPNEAGAQLIATSMWTRLHPLLDSLLSE